MIGAIIGDIIGAPFEFNSTKRTEFSLFCDRSQFTDDTVLTIATADALMHKIPYDVAFKKWGKENLYAGYGGSFLRWLISPESEPYNSYGNGSGMRVSPVGWFFQTLEETLAEAANSAICTHNHPEGIKGAQAIASSIFLARTGKSKEEIRSFIEQEFQYDLNRTIDEIRPHYTFKVICQKSVPESIIAFLDSTDYVNAVRLAISLGGDSDTQGCMAGAIAEAFYKSVPTDIVEQARERLPKEMLAIVDEFEQYKLWS